MFVGDHPTGCADVGRQNPGRVVRRAVERADGRIRPVPGIAEAVVVRRLATSEVGIQAFGGEPVEPLDRAGEFIGG